MVVALAFFMALFSRYRFRLLPIMLVVGMVGWTVMPEDLRVRYQTIWDRSIDEQANQNLDGRLEGFYGGLETWSNYPLSGAGPEQYGRVMGHGMRAHNLYGEVAGELGTFGILAFLFLLSCFGINHYNIWQNYKYLQEKKLEKEGRYCWWVSIGIMYAILMALMQGLGLHNAYWFYWFWFGGFQALTAMIMQEKVLDAMRGKLRPSLPEMPMRR